MKCFEHEMDPDGINGGKYTLRTKSILKRIESERSRQGGRKKESKEKQKPPPLSKYRRKTANARERNRMREINDAFVTLQESLPDLPGTEAEKLTKITVLRLAVNYIKALAKVLDNDILGPPDIDEVKELWSHDNIHIAKSENCVRSVIKASKATPNLLKNSKAHITNKVNNRTSKPKTMSQIKTEVCTEKDKQQIIKPPKKKSKSSKTRGKVCRTASVATSNGAYITLKNVAMQTTRNPNAARVINNEPLMMSMTVKRPRLEPFNSSRASKIPKLEPFITNKSKLMSKFDHILPLVALAQPHLTVAPCGAKLTHVSSTIPGSNLREPLIGTTPTNSQPVCRNLPVTIQPEYQFHLSSQPVNSLTPINLQFTNYNPPFASPNNENNKNSQNQQINLIERQSPLNVNTVPQSTQYTTIQSNEKLNNSCLRTDTSPSYNFTQDIKPLYLNLPFTDASSQQNNHCIDKTSTISIPTEDRTSPVNLQPIERHTPSTEPYSVGLTFQDLDSPVIRNDVLLEFPHNERHLSTSSADSAFYSEGSDPGSPVSTTFTNTPPGEVSPCSSYSSFSAYSHNSECDNVLTASMELGNLLGCEPFEEEFDHLASTFVEGDDTLNILLDHASSNFICPDIVGC